MILSYAVETGVLERRLPPGLEPDLWDGRAFVSLVAFDFIRLKIGGVRVPGAWDFPEWNLRYYVRERGTDRRGVVFIREYVPRRLVVWAARAIYNEPYRLARMTSRVVEADGIRVEHELEADGRRHAVVVDAGLPSVDAREGSREHWFKEHEWGFGVDRRARALVYRVEHPRWRVYPGPRVKMDVDFAALYGEEWGMLNEARPESVVLAEGSGVSVFPKGPLPREGSGGGKK